MKPKNTVKKKGKTFRKELLPYFEGRVWAMEKVIAIVKKDNAIDQMIRDKTLKRLLIETI